MRISVLDILDCYIAGDLTKGNGLLGEGGLIDTMYEEPTRLVFTTLKGFANKNLRFRVVTVPRSLEQAREWIETATELADKYVYALFVLKYSNPVISEYVNIMLKRLEAI